jgi:hypothetical protein
MVALFEKWSIHPLPSSLQIGGIKLESSYRVWCSPDRVKEFDNIKLAAQRGGKTLIEAVINLNTYLTVRGRTIGVIWRFCLDGHLSVRAKRLQADGTSAYEFIPPNRLKAIWPNGPLWVNADYDDIELYGPIPPWIRVTVDNQFYLGEFLTPEFQHTDEYSFVIMRGAEFELGALQASVVRILHDAISDPQNWRYETDIQQEVQCGVISDLFKRHANWSELIEKVGKGRYRLNLHSERGRPTAIFSRREDR